MTSPIGSDFHEHLADELAKALMELAEYERHVTGGPEGLAQMIKAYEFNREAMNEANEKMITKIGELEGIVLERGVKIRELEKELHDLKEQVE